MSIHFEKTFAKKPDLILQLTGDGPELAETLTDHCFIPREFPKDFEKEDITQVVNERVVEQKIFQVSMHVSSKHLIEHIPFFDTLLNGSFSEAQVDNAGNFKSISLKDINNANAFAMLMEILHVRTKDLAHRSVDLVTLYEFCVLIDMYGLHETTAHYTKLWFDVLVRNKDFPPRLTSRSDIEKWICVAYILQKKNTFEAATIYALKYNTRLYQVPGMPLPACVQDDLQERRRDALSKCASSLQRIIDEYAGENNPICPNYSGICDSLVLGGIIRRLGSWNMYPVSPEAFDLLTIDEIIRNLATLPAHGYCKITDRSPDFLGFGDCGLRYRLKPIIDNLENATEGLEWPDA